MLINATRYTARQFVERIRDHLPNVELTELKEENLLTYEEFRNIFERETLQVSLLFDTGEGYFSYCAIAPHLLQKGVGTAIETENAMDEIEKYLMKREEPQKPKVLIVDDSMTSRQGMKELLCDNYEVALAKSGMSALQSISLDKPDLVLLDYEMPVCDGRQVLEMIRSEEDFANLPVIFLTGRTDPESVKKVISLKPEGYLSKYLKHDEIKKKIDDFFERKKPSKDN